MTKKAEADTKYESMYEERGKSAQLPQYDDITIRRMEAINANANLRTWIVFNRRGLYDAIATFHQNFGALVDSTLLELTELIEGKKKPHLSDNEKQRIQTFLKSPFDGIELTGTDMESRDNREKLKIVGKEANEIHELYEMALKKAGFRRISYSILKDQHKWRENI